MTIRTQTRSPGTVVSDDSVGTLPWSDPEGAESEGGDAANATGPGTSEGLLATAYDWSGVPSTARPQTITYPLRRRNGNAAGAAAFGSISAYEQDTGSGNVADIEIDTPAGTEDGDLLLALITGAGNSGGEVSEIGAGYTLVDSVNSGSIRFRVYQKVANSEPASTTWKYTDSGGTASMSGRIIRISGGPAVSPIDIAGNLVADSSNPITASSITTTVDQCRVFGLYFVHRKPTTTYTTPLGAAEDNDSSGFGIFSYTQAEAGATGTMSSDCSIAATVATMLLAVQPTSQTVNDSAIHRVVAGVVDTDTDYALETEWAAAYQADSVIVDVSDLDLADVQDADSGLRVQAEIEGAGRADMDHMPGTLAYDVDADCAFTSHADEGTLERPNATFEWSAEVGGSAITQGNYRIQGREAGVLVYDTGVVVSATQEHEIGSGTPTLAWANPTNGAEIVWTLTVTDNGTADPDGVGDPITGTTSITLTNDWTPPDAPTGLAVTFVTEAA